MKESNTGISMDKFIMSKVITLSEVKEIIGKVNPIDLEQELEFARDLGEVIAKHFGGEVIVASEPMQDDDEVCVHFSHNDEVPEDGGIYKDYDTDITVDEWKGGA